MPNSIPRLLYVDDDAGSLAVMKAWLTSKQELYAATVVSAIPDAAKRISGDRFDLYIISCSDVEAAHSMLCTAIRSRSARVPIILYGDCERSIDLQRATAAGVDLCVNKPADLDVLHGAIPLLLDKAWRREGTVDKRRQPSSSF